MKRKLLLSKKMGRSVLNASKAIFALFVLSIFLVGLFSCGEDEEPEPEVITYEVKFVFNNGQSDTTIVVAEGTRVKEPTEPTKDDSSEGDSFKFEGWYENADFSGDAFDFTTIINSDLTLYANYQATFKVTFNTLTSDGTADSTFVMYAEDGESLPIITIPIPGKDSENQFFTGWFDAVDGGVEYTDVTPITKSLQLYYQMETTDYVAFDVDGENRTLAIGGYNSSSTDQINTVVNFAPPAQIGVYRVTKIGMDMFYPEDDGSNNNTLISVVIPEGVEEIDGSVFRNCSALQSISLPSTLQKIDGSIFWGTSSLSTVVFPEGITYLPMNLFIASGITSVTLPNSLTEIRDAAFAHCQSLTSIEIPDNVEWLGHDAFGDNKSLESVSFNFTTSNLDSIAGGAFYDCVTLTSVAFPNSLRIIGGDTERNMFINNTSLTTITIPENVERLGGGAFALCDKLTEVIFLGNIPPYMEDAVFNKRDGTPFVTIKVPADALSEYKAAAQEPYAYGSDWQWWDNCCGQIIANDN